MVGIDKVGTPTGPGDGGFMVTDQDVPSKVVFEFILFNYNIDGNLMKDEHKDLLDEHIVPFLKANRVHAELTGTASRTGTAAYDRQLSLERVERVHQYLLQKGVDASKVPASDIKAVGKDQSTSKLEEDELERSVRIRIAVGVRIVHVLPHVKVPQVVTPQAPAPVQVLPEVIISVDTRVPWAITELSGFNVGASFGASAYFIGAGIQAGSVEYHFLLVNLRTREMSQCRYFGGAVGVSGGTAPRKPGIGPGGGMSFTQASHTWDRFYTKAGTSFDDFAGFARWTEPGGVGLGSSVSFKSTLTFGGLGASAEVTTGRTIGTPGSLLSAGNFHLKPPVQLQS